MESFWLDVLKMLLRKGATAIATAAVTYGVLEPGQSEWFIAGLVTFGASVVWSLWQRYKDRLFFLTALESAPGTSPQTVKMQAKLDPPKVLSVLLPFVLAAGLLAPACATAPNATPAQRFFINAADANHALAANSKTLTTRLKEANSTDCDLQTEGMQPCLSDDSWAHWKSGLNVAATYGEALTKAISVADIVAARARVAAIIGVLSDLINNGTVRLREDERLIAVSLLTAAKTAFAVLANDGGVQ